MLRFIGLGFDRLDPANVVGIGYIAGSWFRSQSKLIFQPGTRPLHCFMRQTSRTKGSRSPFLVER